MEVTTNSTDRNYDLKKIISDEGTQGTIYKIDRNTCAKIYDKDSGDQEKVIAMTKNPPPHKEHFSWPEEALLKNDEFVGFTMKLFDDEKYLKLRNWLGIGPEKEKLERKREAKFSWKHFLIAAKKISYLTQEIHSQGHHVGDFSDDNILMNDNTEVKFVDCDSFGIQSGSKYLEGQYETPYYSPPEKKPDPEYKDYFALGTITFRLLMGGQYPYSAKGGPNSYPQKIQKGSFPYTNRNNLSPPKPAPQFNNLPTRLQVLFIRCFAEDEGHAHPEKRPTAKDWYDEIDRVIKNKLVECTYGHHYSNHLCYCPWCKENKQRFPNLKNNNSGYNKKVIAALGQTYESTSKVLKKYIHIFSGRVILLGGAVITLLITLHVLPLKDIDNPVKELTKQQEKHVKNDSNGTPFKQKDVIRSEVRYKPDMEKAIDKTIRFSYIRFEDFTINVEVRSIAESVLIVQMFTILIKKNKHKYDTWLKQKHPLPQPVTLHPSQSNKFHLSVDSSVLEKLNKYGLPYEERSKLEANQSEFIHIQITVHYRTEGSDKIYKKTIE